MYIGASTLLLALLAANCPAAEGVVFHASFDRWLVADTAAGGRTPIKQIGGALAEGKHGMALALDGKSYLEFPAGANVPAGPLTVCLWFRPDDWGARTYDNLFGFSDTDQNALEFERSNPGGQLRIVMGGPESTGGAQTRSMFSPEPLENGKWVHIAVSVDAEAAVARLLIDGEPVASLEGPGPFPKEPASLLVGCGWGRLQRAVTGLIDDIVILDHAATPEEVRSIMEGIRRDDATTVVENAALVAVMDRHSGRLTLGGTPATGEQLIVGPCTPHVYLGEREVSWSHFEEQPADPAFRRLGAATHRVFSATDEASSLSLRYHVQLQDSLPLACLWVEVQNAGQAPVTVSRIQVLLSEPGSGVALGDSTTRLRVFTDTGGLMHSGTHDVRVPEANHAAHGAFVLAKPERPWAASLSFASFKTAAVTSALTMGEDGEPQQFAAVCDYPNGYVLAPGDSLRSEVLAVGVYGGGHQALSAWADTVMGVNEIDPPRHCPSGWNSWYAYRLTITEDILLENARIIRDRFAPLGATNVQIDHGWQFKDIVGNWVPNERFPHGMNWLSDELARMGLSLGLWVAVSQVSEFSPLYQEHPELLFKNPDGSPLVADANWYWEPHGKTFTLDPTSPEGETQYRKLGELLRGYGCVYVKNDFQGNLLNASAVPADSTLTRGAPVYRRAMEAFREGMGPDMAYHACNAPLNVAAGMCDVAWVHGDLGNPGGRWDWLRQFARDFCCRAHVSGKFYWSDPDYLQVGQGTMEETRVRMAMMVLGGGPAFICDRLPELPEERLALIPRCLPAYGPTATPLDLFDRDEYPQIWDLPVGTDWDKWHVIGLFNLDEHPGHIDLDLSRLGLQTGETYLVYDFFADKLLGEAVCGEQMQVVLRFPMPATDVRVIRIARKRPHPFVLSTDMHLTQGAVELPQVMWDEAALTLSGTATRAPGMEGTVVLYVPEGYTPKSGGPQGRLLRVPLRFEGPDCGWSVGFEQGG